MNKYTFETLHDKEFELLVNRLISRRENVLIDRFKEGKDGGIDGLYQTETGKLTVIQSKHYYKTGLSGLLRKLKNTELKKIKAISPERYIFSTSVPLSLENKKKIQRIFHPFIKSIKDILGPENLNDLLMDHPDIERETTKLWLTSTNILHTILSNAIYSRSHFSFEIIRDKISKYVKTECHNVAKEALIKNNVLIVTGEGGIGKTTLAEQILLESIAEEYNFYEIDCDISEAESIWNDDQKQIFFFDDFFGRTLLDVFKNDSTKKIIKFINRVTKSKNKRFILTSRSTILSAAKQNFDQLEINNTSKFEYQITNINLSRIDKANLLYNFAYYSELDEEFLINIFQNQLYLDIIDHKNFNPRLISYIFDKNKFEMSSLKYMEYLQNTLANPKAVWEDVYKNQINEECRLLVSMVVFNGVRISEKDLRNIFEQYMIENNYCNLSELPIQFETNLKTLVGSLLIRNIDKNGIASLSIINPSIEDYITNLYKDSEIYLIKIFGFLLTKNSIHFSYSLYKNKLMNESTFIKIFNNYYNQLKFLEETIDTDVVLSFFRVIIRTNNINRSILNVLSRELDIITIRDMHENQLDDYLEIIEYMIKEYPELRNNLELKKHFFDVIKQLDPEEVQDTFFVELENIQTITTILDKDDKSGIKKYISEFALKYFNIHFSYIVKENDILIGYSHCVDESDISWIEKEVFNYAKQIARDYNIDISEASEFSSQFDAEEFVRDNYDSLYQRSNSNKTIHYGCIKKTEEDYIIRRLFENNDCLI